MGADLDGAVTDLRAGLLVGGEERAAGGTVHVNADAVTHILGTALFVGRGEDRLAFPHSSLAAYLAARYLTERETPEAQLRSLFLTAAGDGSASIPASLRETAAWLVTLDPRHREWLAEADPESLANHSVIVDSAAVRSTIVGSLLSRAAEVELSDRYWRRTRWRLDHPGLPDQLLPVLTATNDSDLSDWPAHAQARLALRLAQQAQAPGLIEPLLTLAENQHWNSHMRRLAATAAFDTDPEVAGPRIASVLQSLTDTQRAAVLDPDDELRGALLDVLWPTHITTENMLGHLRPRRRHNFTGAYAWFLSAMPPRLTDADLNVVAHWAAAAVARDARPDASISDGPEDSPSIDAGVMDISELPVGVLDTDLIDPLVDRLLQGPGSPGHLDTVAVLLQPRLARYEQVPIPTPANLVDETGNETDRARDLRHALTLALLQQRSADPDASREDCYRLLNAWQPAPTLPRLAKTPLPEGQRLGARRTLLDATDFAWTVKAADEATHRGDASLAEALGLLASMLFDPVDRAAGELIGERTDHPAWKYLAWWFQSVPLDSPLATTLRQAHANAQPRPRPEWPEAEAHAQRLRDLLAEALTGPVDAYWQLAWNLQFNPATGHGRHRHTDGLLGFPGVAALGDNAAAELRDASLRYLLNEEDHATEWLGTDLWDKRAWAGYLALALFHADEGIDSLPETIWPNWVGAIIWFHAIPINAGDRDRKKDLLRRAIDAVPDQSAQALRTYMRGELVRGQRPWEAELLDPRWSGKIRDTVVAIAAELFEKLCSGLPSADEEGETDDVPSQRPEANSSSEETEIGFPATTEGFDMALDTWHALLIMLIDSAPEDLLHSTEEALSLSVGTRDQQRVAVTASRVLLRHDADRAWTQLQPHLEDSPEFSKALALMLAREISYTPVYNSLGEDQLAQMYSWLVGLFPPTEDREIEGAHFVGPEEQARRWRDETLRALADRGTEQAIAALASLAAQRPQDLRIAANVLRAREALQASGWSPPSPEDLVALLDRSTRRLVRSSGELLDLLLETLAHVADELPGHCELLWDRQPRRRRSGQTDPAPEETWRPKPEAAFSAYLAHELSLRLTGRGIAVNREILVQPTNAYGSGDHTDITVEAPERHGSNEPMPLPAKIVVEIKGAWNEDVKDAQATQLAGRYLPEAHTDMGAYVVGWYPLEQWTAANDRRRARARRHEPRQLAEQLREQARTIRSTRSMRVEPLVMIVPRPHPAEPTAESAGN